MAESNKLRLRITAADGSKKTLELAGTSFIVGSGEEAAIRVSDPKVADLHVRLKVKDGQLFVTDLGTDTGTTIDGETAGKEAPFGPGQALELGDTTLEVLGDDKPAASAARLEKGGKGGSAKGGSARGQGVQVSGGGSGAMASGATDGNAARAMQGELEETDDVPAHEKPTIIDKNPRPPGGRGKKTVITTSNARSVLDVPRAGIEVHPSLREYAARFLADDLAENLRPTSDNKRLQVALVWGRDQFLEIHDIHPGKGLTVGDSELANLVMPSMAGVVPFVQPVGDGFRLLLPTAGKVRVRTNGRVNSGEEVGKLPGATTLDVPVKGYAYSIGLDDRVNVEIGNLQLIARYTKPQKTTSRPMGERIDMNFLSTLVILLLCALAFERMIAITDFGDLNLSDDLFKNKDRFAKYIAKAEQKEKPKFEKLSGVKAGEKPKDDEGKFGKKDAPQKEAAPSKKGAPVVDVNKREEDRKKVAKSGLLALLGDQAGATSNVFGPGGIGTGLNNALGGINGAAAMGDANGVGGLGARGGGAGGGGTGLGIGGLGGHGSGRGRGGSGEFDLGGTGKSGTKFVPGKTTVIGGLTADEVGRIIRRHWNEIKYCYEKELNKDPNLAGKVGIYFVIGPVGDVGEARVAETTMNNANAEECMLSNVRRWKFPAPRGGGTVEVNYPFIFQSQ